MTENFLLTNKLAEELYFEAAKDMPIIDYHCHLPPADIASNKKFENITQVWLAGDHYKWRAMRTNGVDEKYCTGSVSDWEKFEAWAKTVPYTLRNPLYHWTHMELKKPFGITDKLLDGTTAKEIWDECNSKLAKDEFTTQGLLNQFNVETVCSTDDPVDSLEYHKQLKKSGFSVKVLPCYRPDKAMAVENLAAFKEYFGKLQQAADMSITNYKSYIEALRKRHDFFHEMGCRISDHGIETAYAEDYTDSEIESIFQKALKGIALNQQEILAFKSAMMHEFGLMDYEKDWVQQLHLGALRNNSSRMMRQLGPDTGFDSIGDFEIAKPLARFLDKLDCDGRLAKTVIYNLNPRDNELMATMIGNFQDGTVPGKLQYGAAWWFLDQKDGMEKQINVLSNLGLLSRFVGMLTDSRSFLSYSRHEYFRRLLCSILAEDVQKGLLPEDKPLLKEMVKNISYYNAKNYFKF
ncbi:MAG TPA: glucuronate isomerase [Ignavibacteriales bacterium]|nr:glucuronate isomerase [Ignavibacteriales bacterium]